MQVIKERANNKIKPEKVLMETTASDWLINQ